MLSRWVQKGILIIFSWRNPVFFCCWKFYQYQFQSHIGKLIEESSSLLYIVGELKATLQAIEQLFAQGEMARVLQAIASIGWRPGKERFGFSKIHLTGGLAKYSLLSLSDFMRQYCPFSYGI